MKLKDARQVLQALSDDTRLRIINLLHYSDLNVQQICKILQKSQPAVSKHLMRLRFTGMVSDRRLGANVYYGLARNGQRGSYELLQCVSRGLKKVDVFRRDVQLLIKLKTKAKKQD